MKTTLKIGQILALIAMGIILSLAWNKCSSRDQNQSVISSDTTTTTTATTKPVDTTTHYNPEPIEVTKTDTFYKDRVLTHEDSAAILATAIKVHEDWSSKRHYELPLFPENDSFGDASFVGDIQYNRIKLWGLKGKINVWKVETVINNTITTPRHNSLYAILQTDYNWNGSTMDLKAGATFVTKRKNLITLAGNKNEVTIGAGLKVFGK